MNNQPFKYEFFKQLQMSFAYLLDRSGTLHTNGLRKARLMLRRALYLILGQSFFYLARYRYANLDLYWSNLDTLSFVHDNLSDAYSREMLFKILMRNIFGHGQLPPIVNTEQEKQCFEQSASMIEALSIREVENTDFEIHQYNLSSLDYPLILEINPLNVVYTFMFEQYRYKKANSPIGVEAGDIVIDAGGCWGDTALYFAVHGASKVFSFEFLESNLKIFKRNLSLNPEFAPSVEIIEQPLWDKDDELLIFENQGPGSRTKHADSLESSSRSVASVTIDSFVKSKGLDRVDFIKMDIEGAELQALHGASETIREFGPKLAITVYHKPDDIIKIPQLIKSLRPNYRLYLDHFTSCNWETVLFATPERT
ncbi:MAG: FkbM family methyltransferase [Candidatus Flexifilum sp.]|jgi:FkbM family methyltransferase